MAGVGAVGGHGVAHLLCGDLALPRGQRQAFVAGGFDRAGLMYMDMPGLGAQHPLPGFQRGVDHRQVGLGRPHKKVHGGVGRVAQRADLVRRGGAVGVLAIAGGLFQVGLLQKVQYRLGGALAVVTFKT